MRFVFMVIDYRHTIKGLTYVKNFEMFTKLVYFMSSEYSTQLNASRIKVLQAQDDAVISMKDAARKGLLRLSNDKKVYRKLLRDMIVQV